MGAPNFRVRLALETPAREGDGMGGHRVVWQALGWLWAAMDAGNGRQTGGEVGATSVVIWRITVRGAHAGDPRRPRAGQRFRMGARLFRIDAVAEADPQGRWLECHAREEEPA